MLDCLSHLFFLLVLNAHVYIAGIVIGFDMISYTVNENASLVVAENELHGMCINETCSFESCS